MEQALEEVVELVAKPAIKLLNLTSIPIAEIMESFVPFLKEQDKNYSSPDPLHSAMQ
jgi:hypothetical protein